MKKKPIVQDDSREQKMAEMFGLKREGGRIGTDAINEHAHEFELKSTTKKSVSTARDLGPNHLEKWRQRYWIVQTWELINKELVPTKSYFLAPIHMEDWYKKIEKKLNRAIKLATMVDNLLRVANVMSEKDILEVARIMHRGKLMNDPIQKSGLPGPQKSRDKVHEGCVAHLL